MGVKKPKDSNRMAYLSYALLSEWYDYDNI